MGTKPVAHQTTMCTSTYNKQFRTKTGGEQRVKYTTHGWDGVLRLASLPLFPPNMTMVIMAKQFYFCFTKPEDITQKYDLCPHVQLQTIV